VQALFAEPFSNLLYRAHGLHRYWFDPSEVQISTLLSIKTGACPEDCAYCPQSIRYDTGLEDEPLMSVDEVILHARAAREKGATRFCMGAAYRSPKPAQLEQIAAMGMLSVEQAERLKQAGLDYYNHNLDSSESYYRKIITTRCYQDRLDTLEAVRGAGLKVCCGGIIGMGETVQDRAELLQTLATLPEHPGSVPINQLVQVAGTPLHGMEPLDPLEFVRTIAVARILMPRSHVRLSAGRTEMSDEMQALCFFAGANSIFYGDKLLTTDNPDVTRDQDLLARLGMRPEAAKTASDGESRR
jgi:biotin synthase